MKIRKLPGSETKVELQMTPMIDVVFQLLVFFLFSFKIVLVEGEIGVNMPPITAGARPQSEDVQPTEKVKIKLSSAEDGALIRVRAGDNDLGDSPSAITPYLKQHFVGPGGKADEVEVEIDADRRLLYHFVIRVTNAIQAAGVKKIDFTDPMAASPAGG